MAAADVAERKMSHRPLSLALDAPRNETQLNPPDNNELNLKLSKNLNWN